MMEERIAAGRSEGTMGIDADAAVHSAQGWDLSSYQTVPPPDAYNGKVSFCFYKITEAMGWRDPTFNENWANGRIAKIHRGAYHFFHPGINPSDQAEYFVSQTKEQGILYGDIFMADIEVTVNAQGQYVLDQHGASRSNLLGLDVNGNVISLPDLDLTEFGVPPGGGLYADRTFDSVALEFLETVHSLAGDGYPVIVYTNLNVGQQMPSCTGYPLNIAWPAAGPPPHGEWPNWRFWQWSWQDGWNGSDRDAYNGTEADLQSWLDGYVPK
jgi:GH25 family lysozyme M1 (1,4-beta-N-acetylmuramidase)